MLLVGPILVFAALTVAIWAFGRSRSLIWRRGLGRVAGPRPLYRRGTGRAAMTLLMLNLALAIVWQIVTGSFSLAGFWWASTVGYAALWITRPMFGGSPYFGRRAVADRRFLLTTS